MRFLAVILITLFARCAVFGQRPETATEQKRFELEEPFVHPVSIPKPVLKVLTSQLSESGCQDNVKVDESWFTAADLNLNPDETPGLIVKPSVKGGCLLGANVGPFWVFRCRAGAYELVLKQAALEVSALPRRTNGFHDLEYSAATVGGRNIVSVTYRFRNGKYVLAKRRTEFTAGK
jgi:hypothetical protein